MRAQKYNYFYHPLSSIEKNLNLRDNYFDSVRICKFIIKAVIFLGFFISEPQETFSQTLKDAAEYRRGSPIVKLHSTSAPGYCESYGGSTLFESISNVNVVEKPGNLLDITVDVYIANPTGCKSGEPCGVYDNSPEYVNVWIDWNGNKVWEPDEKVLNADLTGYKNINYSGTMTAKGTVEIPPNAVKPAWLRANLGYYYDPDDPCEEYWSYGNVVDQEVLWNMKVKQISATLNIDIQDVPKPVWEADYSENGQTLNVVSNTPIAAGMKNGWFTLPVELVSFPASLGDNSRTNCNWEITGTGINGLAGITGKKGVISVSLPQKIGMYELKLKFSFKNNLNNTIGEQIISLPLWVSYNKPQLAGIKKIWLQKAIEWTEGTLMGSNIEDELAAKIMDGIYSKSGWQYYSYNFLWSKLVEGIEKQGANCNVVANVWLNLLKTLGVGDVSLVNHSGKVNDKGFMVIPGVKAFGNLPSANGDASKDYTFYPTYDRWVFDSHTFGKKGNTYYDPTFDITGTDKYFHVAHDILGTTGGIIYTNAGGPTLKKMSVQFLEGWPKYIYSYPSNKIEMKPVYKPLTGGAKFSGTFTESHNDLNNDGLYDQLTGLVGVEITNPGKYLITGYLRQGGNYITSLPFYSSPVSWLESVGPQTGSTQVQVQFSGERIFSKSLNGPYTIELSITDSTGALTDSASFNTSSAQLSTVWRIPGKVNKYNRKCC